MTELSLIAKATFIIMVGLVSLWMFRRAPASRRSLLLSATFGILLALPVATVAVPSFAVEIPTVGPRLVHAPVLPEVQQVAAATGSIDDGPTRAAGIGARPALVQIPTLLRAAWTAGAIVFMAPIVVMLWRVSRLRRNALPWRGRIPVASVVPVLCSESIVAPMTFGLIDPVVVLPADADEWSDADLRQALVHELEHVRRRDWAMQLMARVVCAIYWFHPLVWVAWRRLRLESERACDDAVLRGAERAAYAEQLVMLARRLSASTPASSLSMASRSDLAARVSAVLDPKQRRGRPGTIFATAALVAAVVLLSTIAPLQAVPRQTPVIGAAKESAKKGTATLSGFMYDPLGGGVADLRVLLEGGGYGDAVQTDNTGHFRFEKVPAGTFFMISTIDFVPATFVTVGEGESVEHDINMKIDTLTGDFVVCAECPVVADTYVTPESLLKEFESDRQATWDLPAVGPAPIGGWENHHFTPIEYPSNLKDAKVQGTVVVEGQIGTDGFPRDIVASADNPELANAAVTVVQRDRWEPARVRGVAVQVPFNFKFEYVLRLPKR